MSRLDELINREQNKSQACMDAKSKAMAFIS